MKKKRYLPNSFLKFAPIPVALCVVSGVIFSIVTAVPGNESKCEPTVARLKELEKADLTQLEQQLLSLEAAKPSNPEGITASLQEGELLSNVQIRQAFKNTVIMGDSITESIWEYGFLDTDVVVSKRGLSIVNADEQIQTAISYNPKVLFMAFGSNDLEIYVDDPDGFIASYRPQVQKLQEALPDTPIYINGILPIQQSRIDSTPALGHYPEFNTALQAMCTELGCTYLDTSFIVEQNDQLYEPDGEHVVMEYYPIWLTFMAESAGL